MNDWCWVFGCQGQPVGWDFVCEAHAERSERLVSEAGPLTRFAAIFDPAGWPGEVEGFRVPRPVNAPAGTRVVVTLHGLEDARREARRLAAEPLLEGARLRWLVWDASAAEWAEVSGLVLSGL